MARVPGKSYVVGGAVRDRLLGRAQSDRDHVVVGTTVDAMIAAGFVPVGRDFPVFLHPRTHEEYALARTERKVAPGYAGFVFHADPSVTLEADLARRDLTINAMAEDDDGGRLIDPFGGRRDVEGRIFRHVGPAFVEDPVRVLRLARFAARFPDFRVAPETMALMQAMARDGEIDALVAERVWQELARGLVEPHPLRMLDVLREAGALPRIAPELAGLSSTAWTHALQALQRATTHDASLIVRFAVLAQAIGSDATATGSVASLCERLGVPRAVRDVAVLVAREGSRLRELTVVGSSSHAPEALVDLLTRCDAWRRPERFADVVDAIAATIDERHRGLAFHHVVDRVVAAADAVDAAAIARAANGDGPSIMSRLRDARTASIACFMSQNNQLTPE